jgi:hypothetical protein
MEFATVRVWPIARPAAPSLVTILALLNIRVRLAPSRRQVALVAVESCPRWWRDRRVGARHGAFPHRRQAAG